MTWHRAMEAFVTRIIEAEFYGESGGVLLHLWHDSPIHESTNPRSYPAFIRRRLRQNARMCALCAQENITAST
jgi:hypothetical protein